MVSSHPRYPNHTSLSLKKVMQSGLESSKKHDPSYDPSFIFGCDPGSRNSLPPAPTMVRVPSGVDSCTLSGPSRLWSVEGLDANAQVVTLNHHTCHRHNQLQKNGEHGVIKWESMSVNHVLWGKIEGTVIYHTSSIGCSMGMTTLLINQWHKGHLWELDCQI